MKKSILAAAFLIAASLSISSCGTTEWIDQMNSSIQDQFSDLQSQIDDINSQINDLKEQIATLESEMNGKITAAIEDYESKIQAAETEIENLNQALDDLAAQFEADKQALEDDYNAKITALSDTHDEDKQALEEDYNNKINALKTTYEAKVVELEESIASLTASIVALQNELASQISTIQNDYNSKINSLTGRLAALEEVQTHTVTFNSASGSAVPSKTVIHGEKVSKPVDPTRPGYTFDGWTYQGEPWVFFGYVVTEDITLDANWTAIDYTVTFKNDDGTVLEIQTPVHYGDNITYHGDIPVKPNPEAHYNYTFDGWDVDLTNITGDTIAIAQYTSEYAPYTAYFLDEENNVLYSVLVKEGETATYVGETPTKADDVEKQLQFQFSGWDEISKTEDAITYKTHFESCTRGLVFQNNEVYQYIGTATSVTVPAYWNGNIITTIGERSFETTSVQKVTLSEGITQIGVGAFRYCSDLESIDLPSTISQIGDSNEYDAYSGAFFNCSSLVEIMIPDCVTEIVPQTFRGCTSLSAVRFGKNTVSIGACAFLNCRSLVSLTIPEGVEAIGEYAFNQCISLTSLTIPNSAKTIGDCAFQECISIKTLELGSGISKISSGAFYECTGLTSVFVPKSVVEIGGSVFSNCPYLVILTENEYKPKEWSANWNGDCPVAWGFERVEEIDGYKYALCSVLGEKRALLMSISEEVVDFEPLDEIDGYRLIAMNMNILRGRKTLKSVVIPEFVTNVPSNFCRDCSSLQKITLPNAIETIGEYAFYGCGALKMLFIPSGLTTIGQYAFCNTYIYVITIPKTLTYVGRTAFFPGKSGNDYVFYEGSADEWKGIDFTNSNSICYPGYLEFDSEVTNVEEAENENFSFMKTNTNYILELKTKNKDITSFNFETEFPGFVLKSLAAGCFYDCQSLEYAVIPDSITDIPSGAFNNCVSLTTVLLPDIIYYIGSSAFRQCSSLTSINISQSLLYIDEYAFYGCNSLTFVMPTSLRSLYFRSLPEGPVIFYLGTEEDWAQVFVSDLFYVNVYFYSENEPAETGRYWHYVDDIPTIWG